MKILNITILLLIALYGNAQYPQIGCDTIRQIALTVPFTAAGTITSTNVQNALQELDNYINAIPSNTDDQIISLASNILTLEDGGTVDLSGYLDDTNTNIYNLDGTLTGNRTVTMLTNSINFDGGDIGIGIASPDSKLHVQDQIKIESNSATAANILLENTSTGDSYASYQIPFAATWSIGIDRSDDINYKISASSALETNTMLTIERLTGNVGIANDSPTQKLHVTGSARITGAIYDSNNEAGTSGQIFTSTATGTDWVNEKIKVSQTIPHTARNVSASGYGVNQGFVVPTELAGSCSVTVLFRFGTPSADAATGVTLENYHASGASESVLVNQTIAIGGRTLSNTFTTTLVAGDLLIPGVGTNGGTQPLGCSVSIQVTKL